jgi:hypothetical protein
VPVETTIKVQGAKEAIIQLRKIDPELRREFNNNIKQVAAPAVAAGQAAYRSLPLSNMRYVWSDEGRKVFPFVVSKAQRGVQVKADTRRKSTASILIAQMDPAAAIFETAGRKNMNRLGQSLDFVATERGFKRAEAGKTRLLGRVVYKARKEIEQEMGRVVLEVVNHVQREMRPWR